MRRRGVTVAIASTLVLGAIGAESSAAYTSPGKTVRVSVAPDGSDGRGLLDSTYKNTSISASGRFVAFSSGATNLVAGDTNGLHDLFVRDLQKGTTERISLGLGAAEAHGHDGSYQPAISADGRYVAFTSWALNLVPGDTNLVSDVFVYDRARDVTERISMTSRGIESEGFCESVTEEEKKKGRGLLTGSFNSSITPDGRYVGFLSCSVNLAGVGEDTNLVADIFVHDRLKDRTTRESISSDEQEAPTGADGCPSLSADGRYVAFDSLSPGLVPEDQDSWQDTFVRDRKKGTTERVSVTPDGSRSIVPLGGNSYDHFDCLASIFKPVISPTGRYVVFSSGEMNLVPNDTNTFSDAFLIDRKTGRVDRISVSSAGQETNHASYPVAMTPDTRHIVFLTLASNLHPGDRWSYSAPEISSRSGFDVFVHDRFTGTTELISIATDGTTQDETGGLYTEAFGAAISANGRFVSFNTDSEDMVEDDRNEQDGGTDVFVRDRGLIDSGSGAASNVTIAGRKRFASHGYLRDLDDLDDVSDALEDAGANLSGASIAHRPLRRDLYVRLDVAEMPRLADSALSAAFVYGLALRANGVDYEARVRAPGTEGATFELYRCDTVPCTKVADLAGGYGTVGASVVTTIPLAKLGLRRGGRLQGLQAFTAFGLGPSGALAPIDGLRLSP